MRLAARLLLAVALLFAQHVALAHQVWHLGKNDFQPAQKPLCEQHDALATVAGALDNAIAETPIVSNGETPFALRCFPGAAPPRVAPASRSPPLPLC